MNPRRQSDDIWACHTAAMFAQEFGCKPGNMWEPPVVRNIIYLLAKLGDREAVLGQLRLQWRCA